MTSSLTALLTAGERYLGMRELSDLTMFSPLPDAVIAITPDLKSGAITKEIITMEQMMIEGVATDLMKAAQEFVDHKNQIAELKLKLQELKEKILIEMKKEGKESLTVTVGTENYFFEINHKEDDLRCVKQTKSPVGEQAGDLL